MTLSYPFGRGRAPLAGGLVIVHVSKLVLKDPFQDDFLRAVEAQAAFRNCAKPQKRAR
jgi:hypothetical protein